MAVGFATTEGAVEARAVTAPAAATPAEPSAKQRAGPVAPTPRQSISVRLRPDFADRLTETDRAIARLKRGHVRERRLNRRAREAAARVLDGDF